MRKSNAELLRDDVIEIGMRYTQGEFNEVETRDEINESLNNFNVNDLSHDFEEMNYHDEPVESILDHLVIHLDGIVEKETQTDGVR